LLALTAAGAGSPTIFRTACSGLGQRRPSDLGRLVHATPV
jgi:hypothetical protein